MLTPSSKQIEVTIKVDDKTWTDTEITDPASLDAVLRKLLGEGYYSIHRQHNWMIPFCSRNFVTQMVSRINKYYTEETDGSQNANNN